MIQKIGIIGSGNVAFHLGKVFRENGVHVQGLYSRNAVKAEELCAGLGIRLFHDPQVLCAGCDLVFLAISDSAIAEMGNELHLSEAILAHCSGSVSINETGEKHKARAVFYPLQSFTRQVVPNWKEIPVLLECNRPEDRSSLEGLASAISNTIQWVDSEKRARIHMAAVLVNNFTNALFIKASQVMEENGVSFKLLLPLVQETVNRLQYFHPSETQTGPAKRGDEVTIRKHLRYLENEPEWKEIYSDFSKIIRKNSL